VSDSNVLNSSDKEITFTFAPAGISGDSMFFEELVPSAKHAVDQIARIVFEPYGGHLIVSGCASTGKTFIIDQFAANIDHYLEQAKVDNLHVITVSPADAALIEAVPSTLEAYLGKCRGIFSPYNEELCLVTESPNFANLVYNHDPKIKIILEVNSATLAQLVHKEGQGLTKLWSSWSVVDTNYIFFTFDETLDMLERVIIPKLGQVEGYNIDRELIERFLHNLKKLIPNTFIPKEELEGVDEDLIVVPIGLIALAIRKLSTKILFNSTDFLKNDDGNLDMNRIFDSVTIEMQDIFDGYSTTVLAARGIYPSDEFDEDFIMVGFDEPAPTLHKAEPLKFSNISTLPNRLRKTVLGQNHAVDAVSEAMTVVAAGLHDSRKPLRSFLFLGPTGVGKTQLALSLANEVAEKKMNVIRLDMSEYSQEHEAAKLFGSPAGYIGHGDGGVLTNQVMNNPQSLILLDEVEKANYKIWDSFLQVLDSGRMTDSKGTVVDFSQCIIVMTSNLGAKNNASPTSGFFNHIDAEVLKQKAVMSEVEKFFRPEFFNRIDEIIFFENLSIETAREIVRREITIVSDKMTPSGFKLQKVEDLIIDEIIKLSDFSKYGARDVQRAVFKNVSKPISKRMFANTRKKRINITLDGNNTITVL